MLIILKVMEGLTFFYTPLGTYNINNLVICNQLLCNQLSFVTTNLISYSFWAIRLCVELKCN